MQHRIAFTFSTLILWNFSFVDFVLSVLVGVAPVSIMSDRTAFSTCHARVGREPDSRRALSQARRRSSGSASFFNDRSWDSCAGRMPSLHLSPIGDKRGMS